MPIFRVKSVKIYTGQKNLHWRRQWRQWQLSGMLTHLPIKGGLYRDDALFASNLPPKQVHKVMEEIIAIFASSNLQLKAKCNSTSANFLDVTLKVATSCPTGSLAQPSSTCISTPTTLATLPRTPWPRSTNGCPPSPQPRRSSTMPRWSKSRPCRELATRRSWFTSLRRRGQPGGGLDAAN